MTDTASLPPAPPPVPLPAPEVEPWQHRLEVMALLLVVSFIPFPTKVVGEELLSHHVEGQRTAALLYALTFLVLALAFNAVWWWAVRRGLQREVLSEAVIGHRTRHYLLGPPAYAASAALAFLSPTASLVVTGLVALTFLLPDTTKATA